MGFRFSGPGTTEFKLNNSGADAGYVGLPMSRDTWRRPRTRLLDGGMSPGMTRHKDGRMLAIVNETFARKMFGETPWVKRRPRTALYFGGQPDGSGGRGGGRQVSRHARVARSPWCMCRCRKAEDTETVFRVRSQRAPERDGGGARTHTERHPSRMCQSRVESWPDALGGCAVPARAGDSGTGVMGLLAAMLAGDGHLRYAAPIAREPAGQRNWASAWHWARAGRM